MSARGHGGAARAALVALAAGHLGACVPLAALPPAQHPAGALAAGAGSAAPWAGFHDEGALDRTARLTVPDIRAMFERDIPARLHPDVARQLAGARVVFPREDPTHPANFYADAATGIVTVPLSSLRFLRDLLVAHCWLDVHGYDAQTVSEYLLMLHYRWPGDLRGTPHSPMAVLGAPESALDDPRVEARFQQLYGTLITFVLSHEMGHLYHRHPGNAEVSPEASRRHEREADAFALTVFAALGEVPVGAAFFFLYLAHLDALPGDDNFAYQRANRTHPLDADRIDALVAGVNAQMERYATRPGVQSAVRSIHEKLTQVAQFLRDDRTQSLFRHIGTSATPAALGPRARGRPAPLAVPPALPGPRYAAFDGAYVGKWKDSTGDDIDVQMTLRRAGDLVTGTSVLSTLDDQGRRLSFGSSVMELEGRVRGTELDFGWRWGNDLFGRGRLQAAADGRRLDGTWGHTGATTGGGTWRLERE